MLDNLGRQIIGLVGLFHISNPGARPTTQPIGELAQFVGNPYTHGCSFSGLSANDSA